MCKAQRFFYALFTLGVVVLPFDGAQSSGTLPKHIFPSLNNTAGSQVTSLGQGTAGNGITYHGGSVMLGTPNVYYIWYGNWAADPTAVTILQHLVQNLGGSPYYGTNTTYYDGSATHISNAINFGLSFTDNYSRGKVLGDTDILAIVSAAITGGHLPSDPNGIYFVLTWQDVQETSGFITKYCGWHTNGTVGAVDIKYAFIGNANTQGLSACATQTANSPNGDPAADAMASVISHELEESTSDPDSNAWYDSSGNENADKCAWTYGTQISAPNGSSANMNLGGYDYLIQQNWVNASGGYCALALPAVPSLTSINPSSGTPNSSVSVVIAGTNLSGGAINISGTGVSASIVSSGATQITASITIAGNATTGNRSVTVTTSGGSTNALTFAINGTPVAAPTFNPLGSTYAFAQNVTISTTTSAASIRYTTDGSTPTSSTGTLYSSPVTVSSSLTLKVIAYKTGMTDSSVATAVYTISVVSANTAAYVKTDSTTQGSWKGVYGANGHNVIDDTLAYPSYVAVTLAGQNNYVWAASSSDVRALQKGTSSTDRIAATWYTSGTFTIDLSFTDGARHQVALYNLDWDSGGARTQTVSILDGSTSAVLDSRNVSSFQNGQYLVWNLGGHVILRVTNTGPINAAISGLLFDPAGLTLAGWTPFGGASSNASSAASNSGVYSVFESGGSGGIYQDIGGLTAGDLYHIRVRAHSVAGTSGQALLYVHDTLGNNTVVDGARSPSVSGWDEFEVNFLATSSEKVRIHLIFTGGSGGVYFDDVVLSKGWFNGFELGTVAPWQPFGSTASSVTNAFANGGVFSLVESGSGGGVYQDLAGLEPGQLYNVSARVHSSSGTSSAAMLWVHDTTGGSIVGDGARVPSNSGWDLFNANFAADNTGKMRIHLIHTGGSGTLYWDDVTVRQGLQEGFENGTLSPWLPAGGVTAVVSSALPDSGAYSLAESGNGLVYRDFSGLQPGQYYRVTVRVRSSVGTSGQAFLYVHDTTGAGTVVDGPKTPSSTGWDEFAVNFLATSTGAVRIHLVFTGGAGTVYWDQLQVLRAWGSGFDNGTIAPWSTIGATTQIVTTTQAYSGTSSLQQSGSTGGAYIDVPNAVPGQLYRITARGRSPQGSAARGVLYVHDGTGAHTVIDGYRTPSSANWDEYGVNFTATGTSNIRVHLLTDGGSGALYWDEVNIVPILQ